MRSKDKDWRPIDLMGVPIKRTLESGMIITCEPGLYFNDILLQSAFNNPEIATFINHDKLDFFRREVGGVRIEDVFIVEENGCDIITKGIPKTVEDVERSMKK